MNLNGRIAKISYILLLAAVFPLLDPGETVFIATAAVGTAIVIVLGYVVIHEERAIKLSWLLAAALLTAYAGGSIAAWAYADSSSEFLVLVRGRSWDSMVFSLAYVYGCCACLLLLGLRETSFFEQTRSRPDPGFLVLSILLGLGVLVAAYWTSALGFQGTQVDQVTRRVTVIGLIAPSISPALIGIVGYFIGMTEGRSGRLFGAFAAIVVLIGIIPTGRRSIVLGLISMGIGYLLSGRLRQWPAWKKVASALLVAVIVYSGSTFFFAMRVASWELGRAPFASQLGLAAEFMVTPTLQDRLKVMIYENMRERTFMIGYLTDIIAATERVGPLHGSALLYYVRYSIPSALDPHKYEVLAFGQVENYVHPMLGLAATDQANTILTDGVTDFGLAGGLAYAIGLLLVLRVAAWAVTRFEFPTSNLFALLGLVNLAAAPEIPLSGYIAGIRDLAWVYVLLCVMEYWYMRTTSPRQSALG